MTAGVLYVLLLMPATISTFLVAHFYVMFLIHAYYAVRGWDLFAAESLYDGGATTRRVLAIAARFLSLTGTLVGIVLNVLRLATIILSPIFALNTLIGCVMSLTEAGELVVSVLQQLVAGVPPLLLLLLRVGPLLIAVLDPAATLEILFNVEVYATVAAVRTCALFPLSPFVCLTFCVCAGDSLIGLNSTRALRKLPLSWTFASRRWSVFACIMHYICRSCSTWRCKSSAAR